ncbi:MAG: penicillin-binding protein 2 [Sedimentisphaerales bacterium]|nr:penicillin-binding protein 2 [Sedimentisphaerales bacterium]
MSFDRRERWLGGTLLVVIVLGLAGVLTRVYFLQTTAQPELAHRAAVQQLRIVSDTPQRGMIVDRQGRTLAVSTQVRSIAVDPSLITNVDLAAEQLGAVLEISPDDLRNLIEQYRDRRFRWVKRFVTDEQADAVAALGIHGVLIQTEYQRRYPMGSLAGHIIGFTDIDGCGLEGIEALFQDDLAGDSGTLLLNSDVHRRPLACQDGSSRGRDGLTVALTIDAAIQGFVEEQLQQTVERYNAAGAVGIVMDPQTGEIYALANYPGFSPATARQCDPNLLRNRVLTDPIEPGSTFKPFTVAAAIEYGLVNPDTRIDCHNGRYSGRGFGTIREYNYHRYGMLTVAEIIMRSSNIGSAIMAQRVGKSRFYEMLQRFGFGRRTGIDLPGEGVGILRPLEQWNDHEYTLTRVAFGQGVAVTPIQLIRAFCVFANGGQLVRPRLTRGLLDQAGNVVRDFTQEEALWPLRVEGDPTDSRQVIAPEVARVMVEDILLGVVERREGTAHNAFLPGYDVFGKTGTAQVPLSDGRGYEEDKYVASFIAGAPAYDPRLCVLVMVREPDRSLGLGYTGGRVAAPPVREILRQSLAYLQIPPRNLE